jgi:cell division protein FtsZ
MNPPSDLQPPTSPEQPTPTAPAPASMQFFGVGTLGVAVINQLLAENLKGAGFLALDSETDVPAPGAWPCERLAVKPTRNPREAGLSEEHLMRIRKCCAAAKTAFVVAGLGGATGTQFAPLAARAAREAGALVLAFVTLPFPFEASRRAEFARHGLEHLKAAADGVICLPNQNVSKLMDQTTGLVEAFQRSSDLLTEGVRGVWRLLAHKGLVEIHFDDLSELIRGRHTESLFAVAEAQGATRSREIIDKLLAHPMLDGGQALAESDAVLVSLVGGPDLTLSETDRVMEQVTAKCPQAQVLMGAALDEAFRERLALTLVAARDSGERAEPGELGEAAPARHAPGENLNTQLLDRSQAPRPQSRFVPPPPSLSADRLEQMFARQTGTGRGRRSSPKMRQTHLPLEIVSKGRFDKSEPTIHKGEDLDVPTYIRRGISLN